MWQFIKTIFLAPYNLYKTVQSQSSVDIKEKPINYKEYYEKAQVEIKALKVALETNMAIHDRNLTNMEADHLAHVTTLQDSQNKTVKKITAESAASEKAAAEALGEQQLQKEELQTKNIELNLKLAELTKASEKQTGHIKRITQQLTENKQGLSLITQEKAKLEEELLLLTTRLKKAADIKEQDIKDYANQRRYLPPEEADKIKIENHNLTVENTTLKETLHTVKKEINHLYDADVKISERLIAYTNDSTKIKLQIAAHTITHTKIRQELEETRHNLTVTEAEINTYAAIKDDFHLKAYLDATDIAMLTNRLRDLKFAEDRRKLLMVKLNDLSNNESVLSQKIADQTISYSKRNAMLVKEINDWVQEKAKYYVKHEIPLPEKEQNTTSLIVRYAETLKEQAKESNSFAWNIDKDKANYTYTEYEQYLRNKKYELSQKYVPDIVRFRQEREIVVVHPKAKESTDIKVNLPYQSKILHPQPSMQQKLVDDIIRKSLPHSGNFIVKKSPVNSGENDSPIYTSSTQKQITATSDSALSEKTTKRLSYYEHTDLD